MTTQATVILNDIRKADDIFQSNFRTGDAASLAALYTEKGMLLPGGSDFIGGKKAIRDFWQGAMDMGIKEARLDIRETESVVTPRLKWASIHSVVGTVRSWIRASTSSFGNRKRTSGSCTGISGIPVYRLKRVEELFLSPVGPHDTKGDSAIL